MLKALSKIKWKHYANYIVIAILTIVFGLMSMGGSLTSSTIYLLEKIAIAVLLAVSLSVVVGFLGELSLGHAGFMCVGAYLGGKMTCILEPSMGNSFITLLISTLVGGAVAAVCGILIGLPALRLKGDYLAIVTLGISLIFVNICKNFDSLGGGVGISVSTAISGSPVLYAAFLIVVVILILAFMKSRFGRAIRACRDDNIGWNQPAFIKKILQLSDKQSKEEFYRLLSYIEDGISA